mgnify:CR=1 FL=1
MQQRRPTLLIRLRSPTLLSALCMLGACGLAPAERDYRTAVDLGTDVAYADYIARYPTYPLAARLAFRLAEREGSIEGYQRFQQTYPTSDLSDQARFRVQTLQRQRLIQSDFASARPGDLGSLLRKHAFHPDAWSAAIQMAKRTWAALDAGTSQRIRAHLRPMLPVQAFGTVRGDLTSLQAGSTAICLGADGGTSRLYCEELLLDGKSFGPIIYDVSSGIYRLPGD